jgi:Zn-dependent M28 family amino/carboxypeptidase
MLLTTAAAQQLFGKMLNALQPGAAGERLAVAYTFVASARNVVAILPGSNPVLRHEYIALGAHNDHIGWFLVSQGDHDSLRAFTHFASIEGEDTKGRRAEATPTQMDSINAALARLRRVNPPRRDSIFNGADDDGSGSVALLEIAEQLAAMPIKPKRSILFVWHAGEENGSPPGSEWFTAHPTVPRDSIVVQLNMDMIGRGDASDIRGGGPNYLEVVGSRRRSTELGDLIDRVNTEGHHNFVFDYVRGEPYFGRSDQYEYAKYGIPIAFFITGLHPDYHQVTDEPEYIDYTKMARIVSLISDVAVHVANLDHRPVIDHAMKR